MIRINISETFPISVSLVNEITNSLDTGETVYYDIRDMSGSSLSPPLSGTLTESTVELGVYSTTESIDTAGQYIVYCTCSGFASSSEEILVNSENVYDLVKQTQNYNISVEDVPRTTASGSETASQLARNVPLNQTDYIITWIKSDADSDWSNPTSSGITYAWYESNTDNLPYRMGGSGI